MLPAGATLLQRGLQHGNDGAELLPRGDFRHDAAVALMDAGLRGDDSGEDDPSVFHYGGACLVTRAFDTQDTHARLLNLYQSPADACWRAGSISRSAASMRAASSVRRRR